MTEKTLFYLGLSLVSVVSFVCIAWINKTNRERSPLQNNLMNIDFILSVVFMFNFIFAGKYFLFIYVVSVITRIFIYIYPEYSKMIPRENRWIMVGTNFSTIAPVGVIMSLYLHPPVPQDPFTKILGGAVAFFGLIFIFGIAVKQDIQKGRKVSGGKD